MTSPSAPTVTVVVVSYNHDKYVQQCLESVISQTLTELDVIIIDDASTDGSQDRILEVTERGGLDARLILHSANVGVCRTFNEGLEAARAPYIVFIAADDWMAPTRLEKQVERLASEPKAALVHGSMFLAGPDGEARGIVHVKDDVQDVYCSLLAGNWILAPSVMSRTEFLNRVGGFDPELSFEDYDMWLRLAERDYPFLSMKEPLVYYRQHPEQMSVAVSAGSAVHALSGSKIHAKHAGTNRCGSVDPSRRSVDEAILAYRLGADPGQVHRLLAGSSRKLSLRTLLYLTLTALRVPGGLVVALWGRIQGVRSGVTRVLPRGH